MKESKRVKRAQKTLLKLAGYLEFYIHDRNEWREIKDDLDDLEKLLSELSVDQKKLFARVVKKIKKSA